MRAATKFIAVLLLGGLCWAQSESLLIGPADLVGVKVLEMAELEQHARVTDAGEFPLILGGPVKIAGLTPAEAARTIEQRLVEGQYLLHPHVSVTVEQFATQNVSVLGQVRSPGTYPIGTPRSILDVLAAAGGLTDAADRKILIERRFTKQRVEYFVSNDSQTAINSAMMVYPGDLVIVPKADAVYVLGDVGRPGGYAKSTNDSRLTLLQAIAMAGGTQPHAVPSHTRLIRKKPDGTYEDTTVQLSAMQKGKAPDMELQADDIIYVPFSYMRNLALGASALVAAAASASIYHF